jgi:hypothetical protein
MDKILAYVRERRQNSSQRAKANKAPDQTEGMPSDEDEDDQEPVRIWAPAQDPVARRALFPLTTVTTTRFQLRSTIPGAKLPLLAENPDHAVAMCHETNDIKEFKLADFARKVVVLPQNDPSIRSRPQRGFIVCTHAVGADQRETEYVPRYYDLSIAALRKNQTYFIWTCTWMGRSI